MKKYIIYTLLVSTVCLSSESGTGFIKNLILPGWGFVDNQEHKDKSKSFLLREIIIWSSLFTSRGISDVYEDAYIGYGVDYANTNVSEFGSMYSINVGNYNSIYSYNEAMLLQRSPEKAYPEGAGFDWEWSSNQNRVKYKQMLQTSRDIDKIGDFAIAGIIVHRIVAGVNYLYHTKRGQDLGLSSEVTSPNKETVQLTFKINLY